MSSPPHHNLTLDFHTSRKPDESHKLEEFLSRLEEERTKIDAFKRELPLCMQLITNAMENSRDQLRKWRARRGSMPVLEEFIPLKGSGAQKETEKAASELEKTCWMTSVQLWSQGDEGKEEAYNSEPKLTLDTTNRTRGAFLPFSKDGLLTTKQIPELGLCSSTTPKEKDESEKIEDNHHEENIKCSQNECTGMNFSMRDISGVEQIKAAEIQTTCTANASVSNGQSHRKARRCWSPELHRRFINALQMLGGSQVATPKQIRELMKVEGLTNDEVKSHLQKYRLHTRRPGGVGQGGGSGGPQLVVLGGIWVPPEYAAHGGAATIYSTNPSPPSFCTPNAPHEFYPVTPMAHALALARTHRHHYQQHQQQEEEEEDEEDEEEEEEMGVEYQLRMYKGCAEEGVGSEGVSDSGEVNRGGGRRCNLRRTSVIEEGDESNNVSKITLKV